MVRLATSRLCNHAPKINTSKRHDMGFCKKQTCAHQGKLRTKGSRNGLGRFPTHCSVTNPSTFGSLWTTYTKWPTTASPSFVLMEKLFASKQSPRLFTPKTSQGRAFCSTLFLLGFNGPPKGSPANSSASPFGGLVAKGWFPICLPQEPPTKTTKDT